MMKLDKVVTGEMKLDKFLQLMHNFLTSSIYYNADIKVLNLCTDPYIEKALGRPIIVYVKKGTLSSSNSHMDFEYYIDEIKDIEDIYLLYALENLSFERQKRFTIRWSIFEVEKNVKQGIGISHLCFLESMQDQSKRSNTVGRLDYPRFEKTYFSVDKYFLSGKIKCQSIMSCLLGIKPSANKNKYPNKVPKNYLFNISYSLTEEDREFVYRIDCPLCGNRHSVVIENNKKSNKYHLVNNVITRFEKESESYMAFVCPVEKSPSIFMHVVDEQCHDDKKEQALLYIFYSLMIEKDLFLKRSHNIKNKLLYDE